MTTAAEILRLLYEILQSFSADLSSMPRIFPMKVIKVIIASLQVLSAFLELWVMRQLFSARRVGTDTVCNPNFLFFPSYLRLYFLFPPLFSEIHLQ